VGIVLLCIRIQSNEPFDADRPECSKRIPGKRFGEMMVKTFGVKNDISTGNLRGAGAYKITSDFEIARHVGGGKALDIQREPNETDRALMRSRELMAQLRSILPAE
jgi:hypothetical protein